MSKLRAVNDAPPVELVEAVKGRGSPRVRARPAPAPPVEEPELVEPPRDLVEEPPAEFHPIWRDLEVARVSVIRLRYKGGNTATVPSRTALAPHDPREVLDPGQLFELYGCSGRFQLTPIGATGRLAGSFVIFDVPDETGSVDLAMPPAVGGGGDGASSGGADKLVELFRDLGKQAEQSRSNDFATFIKLVEQRDAATAKPSSASESSGVLVGFLQHELSDARAEVIALRAQLDEARNQSQRTREQLLRSKNSEGADDMFSRFGAMVLERMGGGASAPLAPSSGAVEPDLIKLPSAAELAAFLQAGSVPQAVIVQAVKLHRAGGLAPDLWALVEPVATMAGLL